MFDNEELLKETKSQALNSETVGDIHVDDPRIIAKNINVFYGDKPAINNASIDIGKKRSPCYDRTIWLWQINIFKVFKQDE